MTVDWHPTEDDLVLHYYEENGDAASSVEAHLAGCGTCAARWREITATLDLANADDVPDPGADFTDRMWVSIQPRLSRQTTASWRPLVVLTALAASLALAIGAAALWVRVGDATSSAASHAANVGVTEAGRTRASDARERVLLTALNDHFSQTEMLLVELLNAPEIDATPVVFEQAAADDLVASGRLYRATAHQTGDTAVAGVLDDLETVLIEVARRSSDMQPEDVQSLRARIRDDALLFKVRAVTTDIHDRQQTWRR